MCYITCVVNVRACRNEHTQTVDELVQTVSFVTSHTTVLPSPHISPQHKPHLPTPSNYFAQAYSPTRGTHTCETLHFLLHNLHAVYHLSADVCRQTNLLSYFCKEPPNRRFEKMSMSKKGNISMPFRCGAFLQPLLLSKIEKYCTFSVCVCSLSYQACNAHAP
jgi:hypothetical protein